MTDPAKKNGESANENPASQSATDDDLHVPGREDLRIAGNTFLMPGKMLDPPEPIKKRPKAQRES